MAEIFDLENMPKLLTGPNQHLFDIFGEIQYAIAQRGSPRSTIILNQFLELFSAVGFILRISKTAKIWFLIILTLWSNPYMHNSCLAISPKYLIFRNAPKCIIDLYGISFLCTNFETFTI